MQVDSSVARSCWMVSRAATLKMTQQFRGGNSDNDEAGLAGIDNAQDLDEEDNK